MSTDDYKTTDAAPLALVAEQANALAVLALAPTIRDDAAGYAMFPDGRVIDWSDKLDRPARAVGTTNLDDPPSFCDWVTRHHTTETVIFGQKDSGRLTAVFNGPHETDGGEPQDAGFGDHRAVLALRPGPDWVRWQQAADQDHRQQQFGELIEELAPTMVEPSGATMLEVALSLTAKSKIDYSSRTNLGNGDVSFKMDQETTMRAGKGPTEIDIPSRFTFRVEPWEGAAAVEFTARLRVTAQADGVRLGFRLLRVAETLNLAFGDLLDDIAGNVPEGTPIYRGAPTDRLRRI